MVSEQRGLKALVSGYPRRLWDQKLLVMLQAYVDDSIAQTGDRRLYLAAYALTANQWIDFSDLWDAALHDEPAIEYFKMSEANRRGGCFRNFSVAQRNRKVFRMAAIIKQFAPHGFHASISITEFNQILKPYVPYPMETPYFPLCFAVIYGLARSHEKLGLNMRCDIIFDEQSGLPNRVLPLFELLTMGPDPWRKLIGATPTFRDDKEVLPLQAADLLAWHIRRRGEGVEAPDYDGILDLLVLEDAHFVTHMDKEILEGLAQGFQQLPDLEKIMKRKDWEAAVEMSLGLFLDFERAKNRAAHDPI